MPLLLLLSLILACLPIDWPAPPFGFGPGGSAALTGSVVVSLLLLARVLSVATVHRLSRDPGNREAISRANSLWRRVYSYLGLAGFGLVLGGCGWGHTATEVLTIRGLLLPGAELLVLAPYLVTLFGSWAIFFDAERSLFRSSPDPAVSTEFWTRWGFVAYLFRYHLLLVFIPVGFTIAQLSTLRVAPGFFEGPWVKLVVLAALCAFIVLLPSLIPIILGLKPMATGPLRSRLEAAASRLQVRYHELYVWDTRGNLATAMVSGLVPRFRQIVFTDLLLATMSDDEVEAVFGHEVGHVKHGHLLYYAAFLLLSFVTLLGVYHFLEQTQGLAPLSKSAAFALSTIGTGAYLFLAFGFVSRRCERQADVFGCKSVSCSNAACSGHDRTTILVPGGSGLCRTGVGTFVRALERVDAINGTARDSGVADRRGLVGRMAGMIRFVGVWLSTWQHSTIANRVSFLRTLTDNPMAERQFQIRVTVLRWGLLVLLTAGVVTMVAWNGWRSLLDAV